MDCESNRFETITLSLSRHSLLLSGISALHPHIRPMTSVIEQPRCQLDLDGGVV